MVLLGSLMTFSKCQHFSSPNLPSWVVVKAELRISSHKRMKTRSPPSLGLCSWDLASKTSGILEPAQ